MNSRVLSISLLLLLLQAWSAAAAQESSSRGLELRRVYYLIGVAEYCGLITSDVYDGYIRESREIIRRENLSRTTWRQIRINGTVDADLQFGNHGIGGHRRWCQTDGMEAVTRFIAFREAELSKEPATDQ